MRSASPHHAHNRALRSFILLSAVVAVVALAATACSSTATLQPGDGVATAEQDRVHAEAILLVGADIGPEWIQTPRNVVTPEEEAEVLAELQRQPDCDAVVANLEQYGDTLDIFPPARVEAQGPRWVDLGENEVTFDVAIYETEQEAAGLFDAMVQSRLSDCYAAAFPALVDDLLGNDPSFTASNLIVEEIELPNADNSYGYRMQVTLNGPDASIIVSTEFAMLRHGRVVYEATLGTFGSAYSIEEDIAPPMWERLFDVNVVA